MLETVTKPDKGTNIADLNLEEPLPSVHIYDIRKSFTPEQLSSIQSEHLSRLGMMTEYYKYLFILFPDLFPVKSISSTGLAGMVGEFNTYFLERGGNLSGNQKKTKLDIAANMQFLFPGVGSLLNSRDLDDLAESLTKLKQNGAVVSGTTLNVNLNLYFELASKIPIISPELVTDLDNEIVWREGVRQLQEDKDNKRWESFILLASQMKVISPVKMSEFKITDQDWQEIIANFQKHSHRDSFVEQAGRILTLQADEIRSNGDKVEVIMPTPEPSFKNPIPALPEVRKF
ncbi:MAG: hypothetical protein Q7R49_01695 [Candidatus Daviesbacteria bacterium]|nr:hypothetical protein [Candidatus Daviesbacteria bacterium]